MKIVKRIVIVVFAVLIVLLGAAAALPYFFKDTLLAKAKTTINENVNAEVEFSDVSLSLFRNFPDISLGLNDLQIQGVDTFADVTLIKCRQLDLTLDLFSVLRKREPIRLEGLTLKEPVLDIRVLTDGTANYDIAAPSATAEEESASSTNNDLVIALRRYAIADGTLRYDDQSLDMLLDLRGIQHTGSGNFTLSVYDLDTETTTESTLFRYAGIDYIDGAQANLDAILNIDQKNQKYTLKDNDLTLNAMHLVGNGYVQLAGEDINMDLRIEAPSNEFKELLSMVPGAYMQGYEQVRADGTFALSAIVNGTYNAATNTYPAFSVDLNIQDGRVQYPDLPLGLRNINADAQINSSSSNLDDMTVQIPTFNLVVADNPIQGRFNLSRPITNPTVDAALDGTVRLDELAQAFPMPGVESLSGTITADVQVATSMQEIDRQAYEDVDMAGQVTASKVVYRSTAYPEIRVASAKMGFSPQFVSVSDLDLKAGKSDVQGSARIDNILAYFAPEKTMRGQVQLRSNLIDANEWTQTSPSANTTTESPAPISSTPTEVFDRYDFALDAEVERMEYEDYVLTNTVARGRFTPARLTIDEAATTIDESDLRASGYIDNVYGYLFGGETLGGDITLQSNNLNLNPFMTAYSGEDESSPAEPAGTGEYGVLVIPDNVDITLRADVAELIYTNMTLRNISGALEVADRTVALRDVVAQAFGGTMRLDGMYDTSDPEVPAYSVAYGMEQMQFQSAFQSLNTMQQLAPIGKFIEGLFTSQLVMEGTLTDNMMPNLSTLDAKGFLETVNGTLKAYPPVQSIANTLRIQELQDNISLKNTRNWVEINDGRVEVKPFDVNIKDIPMTIAGSHGLNQDMAYDIKAAIPRERLENNAVGAAAGDLVNKLQAEASHLGLPFEQSETVNVLIELTGSLTDPKINVRLLGLDGDTSAGEQITGAINQKVEAGKERLEEEAQVAIEKGKEQLQSEAQKLLDSTKAQAQEKAGNILKDAKEKAGAAADTLLKKQVKKVLDEKKAKEEVDNLKKELEKFNPFKKKKQSEPSKPTTEKKEEKPDTTKSDTTKKSGN